MSMLLAAFANVFTHPFGWVLLLLALSILSMLLSWVRCMRASLLLALVLGVAIGWEPPAAWALRQLEDRHAPLTQLPPRLAGVVILGGATDEGRQDGLGTAMPLNQAAERVVHPLMLIRQHPEWTVILSGGNARHPHQGLKDTHSEAWQTRELWRRLGYPVDKVLVETGSLNTVENALLSSRLPGVDKNAGWLLVTSSWHMPRALAIFEQQGWKVTPWPVDYQADPNVQWTDYSIQRVPRMWQMVIHEHVGLMALQLRRWGWLSLARS